MGDTLSVKVRAGRAAIRLGQLRELSDKLQRTLAAVAAHLSQADDPGVDFEIVSAEVGSLSLGLRAVAKGEPAFEPALVFDTFTEDLARIREQSYRADLTPGLTRHYRALVTAFERDGAVVEYAHDGQHLVVDETFRHGFEAALKERIAEDVSVVGYLDAVNAHKSPYTFYVYPKLERAERIECRFQLELLGAVASLLKKTVRVSGTGHFAPVGIYPLRLDVDREPKELSWSADVLRSFIGKLDLVPQGTTLADYLDQNRQAVEIAE